MQEYFELPARDYYNRRNKWSGLTGFYSVPPSDAFDEAEKQAGKKVRFAYGEGKIPVFKFEEEK